MERTSDVMATWAWGLRRYAWIVVLFVIGLGVLVPVVQTRSADVYEAQAQVGPIKALKLPNLDPLPRFAQSVFGNGAVARSVRDLLDLAPKASVVPGTVQLRTAQDNPVMIVTGQGSSPQQAALVANNAASTFVVELNRYSRSVGTFAVQSSALPPAKPDPKVVSGPVGVVIGVLAGLVAGVGAIGLIVALRRPVVGAAAARQTTGLPVLGRVPLVRRGPPDQGERLAVGALSRRLLKGEQDVVHLTGPDHGQVERLTGAVNEFLAHAGGSRIGDPTPADSVPASPRGHSLRVTALDPQALETWVEDPEHCSLTLLVVHEGTGARSVQHLVDERGTGAAAAVVLTTRRRGWTGPRVRRDARSRRRTT